MIIYCCICGKQAVNREVDRYDEHTTIMKNGRTNFGNTIFCGYCAEDLDSDGLFPEERALCRE